MNKSRTSLLVIVLIRTASFSSKHSLVSISKEHPYMGFLLRKKSQSGHWDFLRSRKPIYGCSLLILTKLCLDEKDAVLIRTITKSDVLDLFMSKVHPSSQTRSKLSVQMLSQKPRPKRVSSAAAQAFELLLRQAFPDLDEKAWRNSVEEEIPTLREFGQYWLKVLNTEEGKQVLAQLPGLL